MPQKDTLFKTFSTNWMMVRPFFPDVNEKLPKVDNQLLCPICLHVLGEEHLELANNPKALTIEHVPPEALGGKGRLLLCKSCNNFTGSEIDSELLDFLKVAPFQRGEIGAKIKAQVKFEDKNVGAGVEVLREGKSNYFLKFNPGLTEYQKQTIKSLEGTIDWQFTLKSKLPSKAIAAVAHLKIAYLLAFEKFGHSYILNHGFNSIRAQILNPNKRILPHHGIVNASDKNFEPGLYFVSAPFDVRGILVVYELEYHNIKDKIHILLPPAEGDALAYYLGLREYNEGKMKISGIEPFRKEDFLNTKDLIFAAHITFRNEYKLDLNALGF